MPDYWNAVAYVTDDQDVLFKNIKTDPSETGQCKV